MSEGILSHTGFAGLCKALSVFNPFDVLGLETYELRHTKTLAWLLDPKGSHDLGTAFLRRFLDGLPNDLNKDLLANLDAARVFSELGVNENKLRLGDAASAETTKSTRKESNKRIDVYAQIDSAFFLAIEAKIGAEEHGKQLEEYRTAVQAQAAGRARPILLYLTLDNAKPAQQVEREYWTAINWSDHVLAPLKATLQEAEQAKEGAGRPSPNVMHFLRDYRRTLQKVTGSEDYEPRLLAEQILVEEQDKGPIGEMLDIFHGQGTGAKEELLLELKGIKGGQEAAALLLLVESELRAKLCDEIATKIVRNDWVRVGSDSREQKPSRASTKIDFMTPAMATRMDPAKPHFYFRLDIRRTNTIELKLYYPEAQRIVAGKTLPWPQCHLNSWSRDGAPVMKRWNLGEEVNGGTGQKMAVMEFCQPTGIARKAPEDADIEEVRAWLEDVVRFIDRNVVAMPAENSNTQSLS